jgi:hypothetical protein
MGHLDRRGLQCLDELIHAHPVGQFDELNVMRLLPMVQQLDDRLPGRQLVRPLESIVRRMERRDSGGSCEVRGEYVGGAPCHEDKDGKNEKMRPATSSRHNEDC